MSQKFAIVTAATCLAFAMTPRATAGQPLDQLGNRASAIGAFVAIADDASAVAWNPAGLVNGPILTILLDFGQLTIEPDDEVVTATKPAAHANSSFLATSVLPLGISYSRARLTQLSPAAQPFPDRQDRQVAVRSLLLSQLGVTVLHSIFEGITVGATAKLLRGSFASTTATIRSWDAGFDLAETLEPEERTTGDVDLGVMVGNGSARIGLVARNLAAPTFETTGDRVTLDRHVRIGAAWSDRWPGTPRLIVSFDADLTKVDQLTGERRDLAAGAERWFRGQSIALRGGVRASTVGDARPVVSVGGSVAVRRGVYIDGYAARGREDDRRWGIAGRLSF